MSTTITGTRVTADEGYFGTIVASSTEINSVTTGITAFATGGQADATALTTEYNEITTCATAGDSVKLLTASAGLIQIVKNNGAAACDVFPNASDSINALAANTAYSVAPGVTVAFQAVDATVWETSNQVLQSGSTLLVTSATDATTKDTGSIITEGGIGVEKAIVTGTSITAGTTITAGTNIATTAGTITAASNSAVSLAVGRLGATTPAFSVDSSTASQVAGLKVTGAATGGTVAVVATDSGAAANISIDAKGTGTLTLQGTSTGNIIVGDDIVPDADNALDIGNLANNNRDIHASRAFIKKGIASTEGYGQLALKSISASKAFAGGATEVIPVQVPSGVILVGAQLRNDTVLVGAGAASYSAAYSTGATQAISSGTAFTKNTKVNTFFNVQGAGEATNITSGLTDITLTPNAGTLDTGTVTAVVYYYELTSMTDAA